MRRQDLKTDRHPSLTRSRFWVTTRGRPAQISMRHRKVQAVALKDGCDCGPADCSGSPLVGPVSAKLDRI
jgi:hypothetical protein